MVSSKETYFRCTFMARQKCIQIMIRDGYLRYPSSLSTFLTTHLVDLIPLILPLSSWLGPAKGVAYRRNRHIRDCISPHLTAEEKAPSPILQHYLSQATISTCLTLGQDAPCSPWFALEPVHLDGVRMRQPSIEMGIT
jgi:hypothetical protein